MNLSDMRAQLTRYENFLASDPDNPRLLGEVAQLRLQLGDFAGAKHAVEQALSVKPVDPGLRSIQSHIAMASGEPETAIELLQGLIVESADTAVLRYNLGYALLYARRFPEAYTLLKGLIDEPGVMAEARLLLARAAHHVGAVDETIAYSKEYLKQVPKSAEAWGILSLAYLDSSQLEAAQHAARQALEIDQSNLESLVTLGSVSLETQDADVANQFFVRAVERHPKSGRAWSGMGLTQMLDVKLPQAIESLQQAVTYMPNHIGTWHALAWCYLVQNDLDAAERCLRRSLEIDRSFGETYGGLAVIEVLRGNSEAAEQNIKRALRLDSGSFAARFAQSLLAGKQGNNQDATHLIETILSSRFDKEGQTIRDSIQKSFKRLQSKDRIKTSNDTNG